MLEVEAVRALVALLVVVVWLVLSIGASDLDRLSALVGSQPKCDDWIECALADLRSDPVLQYASGAAAYERGDHATAYRDYQAAAGQGHAGAQNGLGLMYYQGRGVPKNYSKAARWYRLAAGQGNAWAQFNLGAIYYQGLGVPRNDVLAYKWFSLAAAQGHDPARERLDIAERVMTREQIAEAQRRAAAFKPRVEAVNDRQP